METRLTHYGVLVGALLGAASVSCSESTATSSQDDVVAERLHSGAVAKAREAFRRVPLPRGESCPVLKTGAIRNEQELSSLLGPHGPKHSELFASRLRGANIDFDKEALLLLSLSENDEAARVTFGTPTLSGAPGSPVLPATLTLRIDVERPSGVSVGGVERFCFPLVINTTLADMAVLQVNDRAVFAMAFNEAAAAVDVNRNVPAEGMQAPSDPLKERTPD